MSGDRVGELREMAELTSENAFLRRQLEETKRHLGSLTGQVHEMILVNQSLSEQFEQASEIRSAITNATTQMGDALHECQSYLESESSGRSRLVTQPVGQQSSSSQYPAAIVSQVKGEILKLHHQNLKLEVQASNMLRDTMQSKQDKAVQDQWVSNLFELVRDCDENFMAGQEALSKLDKQQTRTEKQTEILEKYILELKQANRELFNKVKILASKARDRSSCQLGNVLNETEKTMKKRQQELIGENIALRHKVAHLMELARTDAEIPLSPPTSATSATSAQMQQVVEENNRLENLRRQANRKAHDLAVEKGRMARKIVSQQESIDNLREQLRGATLKMGNKTTPTRKMVANKFNKTSMSSIIKQPRARPRRVRVPIPTKQVRPDAPPSWNSNFAAPGSRKANKGATNRLMHQ